MSVVFIQPELPQEKAEEGEKGRRDRQEDGVSAISQ